MDSFEILPHTADIRLKVKADTMEGLFRAGLNGMNAIIKPDLDKSQLLMNFRDSINVDSSDINTLLIDFLSAVLTLSHANKAVLHSVKFKRFEGSSLESEVEGDTVDGFDEDIKAVTYTEAEIKKNDGEFEVTIVFDV
jgi:SHS2 domain-containing protein